MIEMVRPPRRDRPLLETIRDVRPLVAEVARPRLKRLGAVAVLVLLARSAGLVAPASAKFIVDDVVIAGNTTLLVPLTLGVIAATLIQAIASLSATLLMSSVGLELVAHARRRLHRHVTRLPLSFYDTNQSGTVARRIMEDPASLRNLFSSHLIEFVSALVTALLAFGYLLTISPKLTSIVVACLAVFGVLFKRRLEHIDTMFGEVLRMTGQVTGRLVESIGGIRIVKGYRAEQHEEEVFGIGVERLRTKWLQVVNLTAVYNAVATITMGVITATMIYLVARDILAGVLTVGDAVTFTAFLTLLVMPLNQLMPLGSLVAEALAGLTRVKELLREPTEDQNPRRTHAVGAIQGSVVFENVAFAYRPDQRVLSGISFEARPGTCTALVGSSGVGKTTITSLIAGFYEPSAGTILIDGVDLGTLRLDEYRRQLGVVLQDNLLFGGTIRDNVAFARPDASDATIGEACRIAHVDEFVNRLPDGYDTIVGERGARLSMGQRQRISIARAVLADPRILLLDEATSSLDSESEWAIQQGLGYLMQGRTTFIVAHRLSTVRRADQILVLAGGAIVERGTHETLYAQGGRYFELATRQAVSGNAPTVERIEPSVHALG